MSKQLAIKLKVCGMRDTTNILQVAALQPDFMGFIFYRESPRYVGEEFEIPPGFPDSIKRVGVFVNAETEELVAHAKKYNLHYLQLHGNESITQVQALKAMGLKIIKVFSVDDQFDFKMVSPFQSSCEYFLFDTKGKYFGGNAKTFDWNLIKQYDLKVPFFLSGGLNPANITAAVSIEHANLFALDINSGVEILPGNKSVAQIKLLLENMKS